MKSLVQFIKESQNFLINRDVSESQNFLINTHSSKLYNYFPQTRDELKEIVDKLIKERGNKADLNDIDTSAITDMSNLFLNSYFDGNISKWDVSNVEYMDRMFFNSHFTSKNGDICNWDISNVKNMYMMFAYSKFNSKTMNNWKVSNNTYIQDMFKSSPMLRNKPIWYKK